MAFPCTALAFDDSLERDLQGDLARSKVIVEQIKTKLAQGAAVTSELAQIKAAAENIRISHMLLEERFKLREEKVKSLGSNALDRHQAMVEGYKKALTEYLEIIDGLPEDSRQYTVGSKQETTVKALKTLLDKIIPKKKKPIIGSLPYKHLNYPAVEPRTTPAITPAYKGGDKTVSPEDTSSMDLVHISKTIADLAQSMKWQPVALYEYVKDTIETEWSWGCRKSPEETLLQKSGNSCEQAVLFASLLRASGFPTRIIQGNIEFFAGGRGGDPMQRAKNLTGIDDPWKIAEFFQKAGIPYKPIIAGGKIANFEISHIWVESFIPMANYRGAIIDEHGKTWLGLDTTVKTKDYVYNNSKDLFEQAGLGDQLSGIRDEYLGAVQTQTPVEYLQSFINLKLETQNSQLTYSDFLRSRTLPPHNMKILPYGMQFVEKTITGEYTEIPDELRHKVRVKASRQYAVDSTQDNLFDVTLPLYRLSNQPIAMSYEPETVEDQEIINSYGGLDNTPSYLVRLRPVLTINKERIVVATDGLPMGTDYNLTIELYSPSVNEGATPAETITNTLITGNLSVIGITAQKAVITLSPLALSSPLPLGEGQGEGGVGAKDAEQLLHAEAINYIDRWNQAEDELASLFHLTSTRPLPTVVTVGGVIDVTYLLDMPHGFTWKGVYVDADLRAVEAVQSSKFGVQSERQKLFMQLSSLQGSILENRIFEDDFQVESISTAKLFQIINQGSGGGGQGSGLLTIDKTNIATILPTLSFADNIKEDIINSVNQNLVVRIPQTTSYEPSAISYLDWTGIGYLKENTSTGESGWMLSGMIAGGMSAEKSADWLKQYYAQTLSTPYTGPSNSDPMAAVRIQKIPSTDDQTGGVVGKTLPQPLTVYVSDSKAQPVESASVTFTIIAGGGKLQCLNAQGNPLSSPSKDPCNAPTGKNGLAKARLTLGEKTGENPWYKMLNTTDTYYTQVGGNLVTATVSSYSGRLGLDGPFEQCGAPDMEGPKTLKAVAGEGNTAWPNNPAGSLRVRLEDRYDNPISNVTVTFRSQLATGITPTVPIPANARKAEFYKKEECDKPYPLYGDCITSGTATHATQFFGAQVEAIAGDTYNTRYTVQVTAALPNVAAVQIHLETIGNRGPNLNYYFPPYYMIGSLSLVNEKGLPVNAAKINTQLKAPLMATLYLLEDDVTLGPAEPCYLGPETTQCRELKATGIVNIRKVTTGKAVFQPSVKQETNGMVEYIPSPEAGTATPGEHIGDGRYQAWYTAGPTPQRNYIFAKGEGNITVQEVFYYHSAKEKYVVRDKGPTMKPEDIDERTIPMLTGYMAMFDPATLEPYMTPKPDSDVLGTLTTIYAVNTELTIEPNVILLSDKGYTTTDITLKYKIEPYTLKPDGTIDEENTYNAALADLDLWKADIHNTVTWDTWTNGDKTQGEGTVIFITGWTFDINYLYTAEVVLNRGTAAEVRSDKKEIPIAQLRVMTDENPSKEAGELKFSDGRNNSNGTKKYHVNVKSRSLLKSCETVTGRIVTLSTATATSGQPVATPQINTGYASQHPLHFINTGGECVPRITDTVDAYEDKYKFIISNRPRNELEGSWYNNPIPDSALLYAGIGNTFMLEVAGAKKEIPIEPLGVFIFAIDGLRQDVLYAPEGTDDGTGVHASYSDDGGYGYGNPYYVSLDNIKGFCAVMGGKYDDGVIYDTCDSSGASDKHIKLPGVTTIFPSITFAAWAGIYTGKTPNETGITGNEFFARDDYYLNYQIYGLEMLPLGMTTLDADGGAFRPLVDGGVYSKFKSLPFILWHVMPAEFSPFNNTTMEMKLTYSVPKHALRDEAKPLWADINTLTTKYYQTTTDANKRCDQSEYECRTVSMFNQYAEGVDWWGTPSAVSASILHGVMNTGGSFSAAVMDSFSADETAEFIGDYFSHNASDGKRKRFPALFSVYLSGLDHFAHVEGMDKYANYLKSTTDSKVEKIVKALKDKDEFENKIFIIVSDHGETQMPTDLKYKDTNWLGFQVDKDADMSCELKTDFGDTDNPDMSAQNAELNNNSLHIWELATMFQQFDQPEGLRLLVPKEIEQTIISGLKQGEIAAVTSDINQANVIAALNGPMAHIYVKRGDGWSEANNDEVMLGRVADKLKMYFGENGTALSEFEKEPFPRLLSSIDTILARVDGNYKVFKGVTAGEDGNITGLVTPGPLTELESNLNNVKAVSRIERMNHSKRSGDIVLLMKDDLSDATENRYSTAYACKSWHGSLNKSDTYVPFIIAYPGGNKQEFSNILTTVCPNNTCEGNWILSDLIKKIVETQYSGQ